ncbi:MAG: ubiquinol-cytochrome c reductase iron-sulfur subunit [Flavobacteriaceae bacterium]
MERKEFMRTLGAGAAFALTFPCLHGCSKDDTGGDGNVQVPEGVDFTIDLTSTEGQKLANNGSFIVKSLVVVARNLEGRFVAASQVCSHRNYAEVEFVDQQGGIFYCDVHGSRFAQNGTPLNQVDSDAAKPLKIFNTELNGDILRVFEA